MFKWMESFLTLFRFVSSYQNSSGQMRLRVTTLSRRWVAGPGSIQVSVCLPTCRLCLGDDLGVWELFLVTFVCFY